MHEQVVWKFKLVNFVPITQGLTYIASNTQQTVTNWKLLALYHAIMVFIIVGRR